MAGVVRAGGLAVLTCAANATCAPLHDRMPVVLAGPAEEAAWLASGAEPEAFGELSAPLAADRVHVAAADPDAVNRAGPAPAAAQLVMFDV